MRKTLKAVVLMVDSSILTSVGNDYGFDDGFYRQIEGLAVTDDVLIDISTSGNLTNVLNALKAAHSIGVRTVGMTGRSPGRMDGFCDVMIPVPPDEVPHIQELHTAIGHIICDAVEKAYCA